MHTHRKNTIALILICWSIIDFLIFFFPYIGLGDKLGLLFTISGYKLMVTFNIEPFISILAVIQIIYTLVIFGMLVLGILIIVNKNNSRQITSIFRLLPFLVLIMNIIFTVTMVVGIRNAQFNKVISVNVHWTVCLGTLLSFCINFIFSIILLFFSKKLLESDVQS